jgi:hypothetical protein
MAQVIECLPSKCKVLEAPVLAPPKKKKNAVLLVGGSSKDILLSNFFGWREVLGFPCLPTLTPVPETCVQKH